MVTMPLVSALHATRSIERFDMFWQAYDWCVTRANYPDMEYIIGADADDVQMIAALQREIETGNRIKCPTKLVIGPKDQGNNGCWNNCYDSSTGKIVIQMSDDFECPPDWVHRIGGKINGAGGVDAPLVVGVGDPHWTVGGSCVDKGAPPPYSGDGLMSIYIATRAYLEKVGGFVLHPDYISVFSDAELPQKAALDDCLVDAYEEIHFYHHWHGGEHDPLRDDTYFRHLTTHCNQVGQQVLGNRYWGTCADIYKEKFPHDRDMTLPEEGIAPAPMPEVRDKILLYQRIFEIERFLGSDACTVAIPTTLDASQFTAGSGFTSLTKLASVLGGAEQVDGAPDALRGVIANATGLAPDHISVATLATAVANRKTLTVKNKPPTDPIRKAWLAGEWKECRDRLEPLMAKYHLNPAVCGGRFLFHLAHHLWYTCTEQLGDKALVGVREHHG
jgi:hypothetical protein